MVFLPYGWCFRHDLGRIDNHVDTIEIKVRLFDDWFLWNTLDVQSRILLLDKRSSIGTRFSNQIAPMFEHAGGEHA